jgi:hypothetical protein
VEQKSGGTVWAPEHNVTTSSSKSCLVNANELYEVL